MGRQVDDNIFILFHMEVGEDFKKFREMLNLAEDICDMVTEDKEQANRKFDKMLDIAMGFVKADGRSAQNSPPKDSQ